MIVGRMSYTSEADKLGISSFLCSALWNYEDFNKPRLKCLS